MHVKRCEGCVDSADVIKKLFVVVKNTAVKCAKNFTVSYLWGSKKKKIPMKIELLKNTSKQD